MVYSQVMDGEDSLWIWRIAVNILNEQPWISDKGWFSSLGLWQGPNNLLS
jgi:hypothetical protein